MRVIVSAAIALLASACGHTATTSAPTGEPTRHVAGVGLALDVPPGWRGWAAHGLIAAGSFPTAGTGPPWATNGALDPNDVLLVVAEHDAGDADGPGRFVPSALPVRLAPEHLLEVASEAWSRYGTGRDEAIARRRVLVHDRRLRIDAIFGRSSPSPDQFATANRVLRTLTVDEANPYTGMLAALSFTPADGWHDGSTGPAPVRARGVTAEAWTATIPWAGEGAGTNVHETVRHLTAKDVAIWALTSRSASWSPRQLKPLADIRLADAERAPSWEGQPSADAVMYWIAGRLADRYAVDVRIFFGTRTPSEATLALARRRLEQLRLPDWPGFWYDAQPP